MAKPHHFVEDGQQRARVALLPIVRAEVEAEFADHVQEASAAGRLRLKIQIRREIERRVQSRAPADGLY